MSDINLIISATDSASPVLKRIERSLDGLNRQASRAQKSSLTLGKAFRGLGIAAAAIGLGRVASNVVSTISKFESLKASLRTVTGSADAARVAFHQIQQFTAQTPFQLDEVTNAFTILKRNGIDTSMESLEAFGNIAAANGKSFEQLAEAIADGMTGEFERLKEFGIKVRKENDQFVASMGDTQIAVSASASDLMNSLRTLGEEGGRYADGLEQQAATLGGKFSNLQDNMSQFAASIGEGGLSSALKDTLDVFNGVFDSPKVLGFARTLGAGLGAALNTIVKRVQSLGSAFSAIFSAIAGLGTDFVMALKERFDNLKNMIPLREIVEKFQSGFNEAGRIVSAVINFILNTFRAMYEQIFHIISNIREIFKQVFIGIGNLAKDFGSRLVNQFSNIGRGVAMAFQAAFSSEITFADALQEATKNAFDGFDLASNFQMPEVMLSREDIERIYGIDNIGMATDAIATANDQIMGQLSRLGISIDAFVPGATFRTFMDEFNRLTAEGAEEQAALEAALEAASDAQDDNATSTTRTNRAMGTQITYAQKLANAFKSLVEQVTGKTEQDLINADLLPQINQAYADGTLTLGQYSEALTQINSKYEPMQVKAYRTAESIKQGFANMAGAIGDVFFNMFTGVTSVFEGLKNIAKMVLQMVMKAIIQAYIVKPLLAMMGIPMFANGGIATAGQPAIVGERGPELIVPNKDSRIFSNSETKRILSNQPNDSGVSMPMGNGSEKAVEVTKEPLTVNFNLTAVDTKSGVQFLLENKQTITGMVQQAYNQRGVRGPLG